MKTHAIVALVTLFSAVSLSAQQLYNRPPGDQSRWSSFENPTAGKGAAGSLNKNAKGRAFDRIEAGDSAVLLDLAGPGRIDRIWMTVDDRSPVMLRSLLLKVYWDDETVPAVAVPLGDFFCHGAGAMSAFENALFSSPEGRSFNCIVPMPFRKSARVVLVNQSDRKLMHLFYDINCTRLARWDEGSLYFHAFWNRENPTALGRDYTILPKVEGTGRFLGVSMAVQPNKAYLKSWWGEGEVKAYLDGDTDLPTLCGTGTEDYIGTAWGQGVYAHQYQGCLVGRGLDLWTFYRLHIPDPIYFYKEARVTIQPIGGCAYAEALEIYQSGAPMIPVTVDDGPDFHRLLDSAQPLKLTDPGFPKGWVNFYRQDDYSSTAYFYLDRPGGLFPVSSLESRTKGLLSPP